MDVKTAVIGWGVVYVVLLVLAETSIGPIAVAFAWLIVTTELFAFGPGIAGAINKALSTGSLSAILSPPKATGGGGSGPKAQ